MIGKRVIVINFRTMIKNFSKNKMNARIKLLGVVGLGFGREYFPIPGWILTGFVLKFYRNLIPIFIFTFAIRCLEILSKFNFHFYPRISRVCVRSC